MNYQCPNEGFPYIIQAGDTLYNLANRYNITLEEIYTANPGINPDLLQIGQVICIPAMQPTAPCPYGGSCPQTENLSYSAANSPYDMVYAEQTSGPPRTPPPSFTPPQPEGPERGLLFVDPGAIRPCVFRFSYIWLRNGQSFWAYLIFVGRNSVAGWRFRNGRWVYFGVDLREIVSFSCF